MSEWLAQHDRVRCRTARPRARVRYSRSSRHDPRSTCVRSRGVAEQTVVWRLDLHDTTHTQHTNLVRRCSLYLVESNQLLNYTKTRKGAENGVTSMDGIARVLRSFMSEVVLVLTLAFRLLRLFKSATRPRRCVRVAAPHTRTAPTVFIDWCGVDPQGGVRVAQGVRVHADLHGTPHASIPTRVLVLLHFPAGASLSDTASERHPQRPNLSGPNPNQSSNALREAAHPP